MLKVGVVGLNCGAGFVELFRRLPECKVTVVCDTNEELLRERAAGWGIAAAVTDYDRLLDQEPDLVVIESPVQCHVPQAVAALERGIHVLSDVTAGTTIEDCARLARAVLASPAKYMLGENCCYWHFAQWWREMVREGRLGQLTYMEAEYVHDVSGLMRNPDGTPTWRASRPPLHYCTHSLGPLLNLAGDRCVTAVGLNTGAQIDPELGAIDMGVGLFHTEQGAVVKILRGALVRREPAFHYYSVYGTRGCLETTRPGEHPMGTTWACFGDHPQPAECELLPLGLDFPGLPDWAGEGGHGTAEYVMVRAFLDSILQDTPPPLDLERGLAFTLPGLVAHLSAQRGGVRLPVPSLQELVDDTYSAELR